MATRFRIGTSGWHYAHWRGAWYPASLRPAGMLGWYAGHFDTVEIDSSFYRLPGPEVFAGWRTQVPPGFRFAVKASRFITHMKRLKDPEEPVARLWGACSALEEKLGPLLFQLPPRFGRNVERLEGVLARLPPGVQAAFEFRDPSWHHEDVYACLAAHGAAFCVFEIAGFVSPLRVTADWAYVRLHGPGAKYTGSYAETTLAAWAERLRDLPVDGTVWVYFDNDVAAAAPHDAAALKDLLRAR